MESTKFDKIYQRIGEFVVSFQWLEHRFREIGWLIQDPNRRNWPPQFLRKETNYQLLETVKGLYFNLIDSLDIEQGNVQKQEFASIVAESHVMRRYRNNLLHSAILEMKGGGEMLEIIRSNPRISMDNATGEVLFDQETLTEEAILGQMKWFAELALKVNKHYIQQIHWAGFDYLKSQI